MRDQCCVEPTGASGNMWCSALELLGMLLFLMTTTIIGGDCSSPGSLLNDICFWPDRSRLCCEAKLHIMPANILLLLQRTPSSCNVAMPTKEIKRKLIPSD
jgi:hypothetical protein